MQTSRTATGASTQPTPPGASTAEAAAMMKNVTAGNNRQLAATSTSRRQPATAIQWLLLALGIVAAGLLLVLPLAMIFARVAAGG